jgi:hypothetical protein
VRLIVVLLVLAAPVGAIPAGADWRVLAPGMDLQWVVPRQVGAPGDLRIAVVRMDPAAWQLEVAALPQTGAAAARTAREWAKTHGLAAAINAGMFGTDQRTHVGYLESRGRVYSSRVNRYQSVAAFDPREPGRWPPFRIFDLDAPGTTLQGIRRDYASVVQNLRLIQRPGVSRWSPQARRWSEAALGEDQDGRILFILSRAPFSMHDLSRELLSAGIGLMAAQHLEGGAQAQLYVNAGDAELELLGRYAGAAGTEDSAIAWPIPHVLGVRPRVGPS